MKTTMDMSILPVSPGGKKSLPLRYGCATLLSKVPREKVSLRLSVPGGSSHSLTITAYLLRLYLSFQFSLPSPISYMGTLLD